MKTTAPLQELLHRCHNYSHLIARWQRIARTAGVRMEAFAQAGEYPVYCVRSRENPPRAGGVYLSAGIHGDEPAAPEALAVWAENHLSALTRGPRALPVFILPCLNPFGLINNQRADARGRDLNRLFDRDNIPPIRELKRLLTGWRFSFGLSLHEDYDAQGIYGYEVNDHSSAWGPSLLETCSRLIPRDPRARIEGRAFTDGLMFRRRYARIPLHPENLHLHRHGHAAHTLTFETPSEFSLARRVQAHVLLIEECMKRVRAAGEQRDE